eukprot:3301550-Prymnesium_polylepis.2
MALQRAGQDRPHLSLLEVRQCLRGEAPPKVGLVGSALEGANTREHGSRLQLSPLVHRHSECCDAGRWRCGGLVVCALR